MFCCHVKGDVIVSRGLPIDNPSIICFIIWPLEATKLEKMTENMNSLWRDKF